MSAVTEVDPSMRDLLEGVRVIEVASEVAGPFAARILADAGASCIKVEPPEGDISRTWGPFPGGIFDREASASFAAFNHGKSNIVLDLNTERDQARLDEMLTHADVLIEDGTLDIDAILERNPGLVIVSVTPMGRSGIYEGRPATDITAYAMGGAMSSTGLPEREPYWLGGSLIQAQAGNVAACAATAGLMGVETSGKGQIIDVSWIEAELASMERAALFVVTYTNTGINARRQTPQNFPLPTGILPCADGYVVVSTYGWHLERMLDVLESSSLDDLLRETPGNVWKPDSEPIVRREVLNWLATKTRAEASEIAQRHGWCVMPVNEMLDLPNDKWLSAAHALDTAKGLIDGSVHIPGPAYRTKGGPRYRGPAPRLDRDATVTLAPESSLSKSIRADVNPARPLEGVRVLDLCVVLSGPGATLLLADLGAEVIMVESCQHYPNTSKGPRKVSQKAYRYSDNLGRGYVDCLPGDRPWRRRSSSLLATRNKLSMTVDLTTTVGREIFLRLCESADCVLENNLPEVLQRLDLTWDVLHQRNPRLVLIRMPPLSSDGSAARARGVGSSFEALAGLLPVRGYPELGFEWIQASYRMDAATGPTAAMAAMLAIRRARETGQGAEVVVSQTTNLLHHVGDLLIGSQVSGENPIRMGNRHPRMSPHGCYPASGPDEWVALACRDDGDWEQLRAAMDMPDWTLDLEFQSSRGRVASAERIDLSVASWTSTRPGGYIENRLAQFGVPVSRVRTEADKLADPHLRSRNFFRSLDYVETGVREYPGHLWRSSAGDLAWDRPAPTIGQDNDYVYGSVLKYSEEEIAELRRSGQIGDQYEMKVSSGR